LIIVLSEEGAGLFRQDFQFGGL